MKKFSLLFLTFVVGFFGFFLLFSCFWIMKKFGDIDFGQILFHLSFPLLSADGKILLHFSKSVIPPSLILSLILLFLPQIIAFFKLHKFFAQFALSIAILSVSLVVIDKQFRVVKYYKTQKKADFSNFYENNYANFGLSKDINATNLNNLVVIFAESLESTFSAQNFALRGGGRPA